ncbi:protein translocase subunit SecD [Trebonia kvetii]|uniref:Protein translocase subunit SecD n=1 Tax=Trebonia kvetii TaxID=2480626 RepID=A0A6P2BU58_9ACTN|nr:protein translocase subunit SecD [Trebonia kvetii]TVZ02629.1 protein translocase subunit SecD [Trebonia kvetii]
MKPPSRSGPRPVRALIALAAIIVIMLISVLGNETLSPGKWHQQFKVGLGLDLSSGTEVVLKAETHDGKAPASGEMRQAIAVEQSRVDRTGTSGAQVQQQGSDTINVTVPGKPSYDLVTVVSRSSQLSVRPVYLEAPYVPPSAASASPVTYGDAALVNAATLKLFDKEVCTPGRDASTVNPSWQKTVGYSPSGDQWGALKGQIVSCDSSGTKYVLGQAAYVGSDITSVNAGLQQDSAQWVVDLSLDNGAAAKFATLTTSQYGSYYAGSHSGNPDDQALDSTAVVLDGNVTSAEETAQPITAGNVQITAGGSAGFTQAQATSLADTLKYGSLPLYFKALTANTISAQLGRSSLDAGLIAGIIGLALVTVYLFAYYRGLGLVAVSSLLLAALLAYLSVVLLSKYQHFTMSLSAIAGLVVAIGITADSFIIYFERLRDDARDGKSLRSAAESGWKRARRTILVSDTVSFLAAALLYHFAVSDVQGFAYTLGLTTLIDVLVVFLFTRPMVTLLARTRFFGGGHRWSGLDPARLGAKAPWRSSRR